MRHRPPPRATPWSSTGTARSGKSSQADDPAERATNRSAHGGRCHAAGTSWCGNPQFGRDRRVECAGAEPGGGQVGTGEHLALVAVVFAWFWPGRVGFGSAFELGDRAGFAVRDSQEDAP